MFLFASVDVFWLQTFSGETKYGKLPSMDISVGSVGLHKTRRRDKRLLLGVATGKFAHVK